MFVSPCCCQIINRKQSKAWETAQLDHNKIRKKQTKQNSVSLKNRAANCEGLKTKRAAIGFIRRENELKVIAANCHMNLATGLLSFVFSFAVKTALLSAEISD